MLHSRLIKEMHNLLEQLCREWQTATFLLFSQNEKDWLDLAQTYQKFCHFRNSLMQNIRRAGFLIAVDFKLFKSYLTLLRHW
jgi:hypothetical protein